MSVCGDEELFLSGSNLYSGSSVNTVANSSVWNSLASLFVF